MHSLCFSNDNAKHQRRKFVMYGKEMLIVYSIGREYHENVPRHIIFVFVFHFNALICNQKKVDIVGILNRS